MTTMRIDDEKTGLHGNFTVSLYLPILYDRERCPEDYMETLEKEYHGSSSWHAYFQPDDRESTARINGRDYPQVNVNPHIAPADAEAKRVFFYDGWSDSARQKLAAIFQPALDAMDKEQARKESFKQALETSLNNAREVAAIWENTITTLKKELTK